MATSTPMAHPPPSHPKSPEVLLWEACSAGDLPQVTELLALHPDLEVNFPHGDRADTPLIIASRHGRTHVVEELLRHPRIDVNKANTRRGTAFCVACAHDQLGPAKLLLADPRVDVNLPTSDGGSPVYFACMFSYLQIIDLLLADPRVEVNTQDCVSGSTPLWIAAQNGLLEVAQRLLVSDKPLNLRAKTLPGVGLWHSKTALEIAVLQANFRKFPDETPQEFERRLANCKEIARLLEMYQSDPEKVRVMLACTPGLQAPYVAQLFALVVFLSDNYLTLTSRASSPQSIGKKTGWTWKLKTSSSLSPQAKTTEENARRFLKMAVRLPMELQMVLCNRVFESPCDHVFSWNSEPAFRKLAQKLAAKKK